MEEMNDLGKPANKNEEYMAIGSFVLGLIMLCGWFIPLCGFPLAVIGIVLGFLGRDSGQRTLAIIGIALCALGLLLTIGNAILGAYLGFTGFNGELFQ